MSIFKDKWFVLKVTKVKAWEFLYTIFTSQYWKILCNKKLSKKEKTLDLWYLVNFEIYTKENVKIHKIRNIKIISEFNFQNRTFNELNNYLIVLSIVANKIPNWIPIYEIFNILELINNYKDINETNLILTKLKIISIFWELNENNDNKIVSKVLKFINSNKIERILILKWINLDLQSKLENIK